MTQHDIPWRCKIIEWALQIFMFDLETKACSPEWNKLEEPPKSEPDNEILIIKLIAE